MEFCKTCLILRAFYLQSPLVLFLKKRCLRWHQFFISFWLLGCSNVLQQKKDGKRQWRQCLIDTPTPIVIGFYLWRGVSVFVWERGLVSILERRRSKPTTNNLGSLHLGHPKEKKKHAHSEAGKTKTSANWDFMLCEWSDRESVLLFTYFVHFIIVMCSVFLSPV